MPSSAPTCPPGSGGSPIRSATGTASRRRWRRRSSCSGGSAGAARRGSAARSRWACCRSPVLALWATDSRGGFIAALLACAVLIGVGPSRSATLAGLAIGGVGGLVAVIAAQGFDDLFQRPGSDLGGQGGEMLALTILIAAATGSRTLVGRPAGGRAGGAAGARQAGGDRRRRARRGGDRRLRPGSALRRVQDGAAGHRGHRRLGAVAQRQQRPLAVLEHGRRRLRERPGRRARRRWVRAVLDRASRDCAAGDQGALAVARDARRARDRRAGARGRVLRGPGARGDGPPARARPGGRAGSGARCPRGRLRGRERGLDLGPARRVRGDRHRGGAAQRPRDPAPRAAGRTGGGPGNRAQPAAVLGRRRGPDRRLGVRSAPAGCCCSPTTRSTPGATSSAAAASTTR